MPILGGEFCARLWPDLESVFEPVYRLENRAVTLVSDIVLGQLVWPATISIGRERTKTAPPTSVILSPDPSTFSARLRLPSCADVPKAENRKTPISYDIGASFLPEQIIPPEMGVI